MATVLAFNRPPEIDARTWLQAAEYGETDKVKALLAAGVDVNAMTSNGKTALIAAATSGHLGVVQILLAAGADVNVKRSDGFTALIAAAFFGHADVVQALLDKGADLSAETELGSTAQKWASSRGFIDIVRLLNQAEASRRKVVKLNKETTHSVMISEAPSLSSESVHTTLPPEPGPTEALPTQDEPNDSSPASSVARKLVLLVSTTAKRNHEADHAKVSAPHQPSGRVITLIKASKQQCGNLNAELGEPAISPSNIITAPPDTCPAEGNTRTTVVEANEDDETTKVPSASSSSTPASIVRAASVQGAVLLNLDSRQRWQRRGSRKTMLGTAFVAISAMLFVSGISVYKLRQQREVESKSSVVQPSPNPGISPAHKAPLPVERKPASQVSITPNLTTTAPSSAASTPNAVQGAPALTSKKLPSSVGGQASAPLARDSERRSALGSVSQKANVQPTVTAPIIVSRPRQVETKPTQREEQTVPTPVIKKETERQETLAPRLVPSRTAALISETPSTASTPLPSASPKKKVIPWP